MACNAFAKDWNFK
jgi:hypothetical protein